MQNRHLELGENSFGEIFHVALYRLLGREDENCAESIKLSGKYEESFKEFLEDIEVRYPTNLPESKFFHLPQTSVRISEAGRCRDKICLVKEKILNLAEQEQWKMPLLESPIPESGNKILIWERAINEHHPERNSSPQLILQLAKIAQKKNITPVIFASHTSAVDFPEGTVIIKNYHKLEFFNSHHIAKQLWFQHKLFESYGVKASVGMMSGALDGGAMFFGHRTIFFTNCSSLRKRMPKVAKAIKNLELFHVQFNKSVRKLSPSQAALFESMI